MATTSDPAGPLWTPEQFRRAVGQRKSSEIVASGIGYDLDHDERLTAVLCQLDSTGVIHVDVLVNQ